MRTLLFSILIFFSIQNYSSAQLYALCDTVKVTYSPKVLKKYYNQKISNKEKFLTHDIFTFSYSDTLTQLYCYGVNKNDSAYIALASYLLCQDENRNPYYSYSNIFMEEINSFYKALPEDIQYKILENLFEYYRGKTKYANALDIVEKRVTLGRKLKIPEAEIHYSFEKAIIHLALREYNKAEPLLNKIIKNHQNYYKISDVYFQYGATQRRKLYDKNILHKSIDPSLSQVSPMYFYRKSIEKSKNESELNNNYLEIGHYYANINKLDSSLFYFNKIAFKKDTLYFHYIFSLIGKGTVYRKLQDTRNAEVCFTKALNLAKKYKYNNFRHNAAAALLTVTQYPDEKFIDALDEMKTVYHDEIRYNESNQLFFKTNDELLNKKHEVDKLQLEQKIKEMELRRNYILMSIFFLFTLLAAIFAYFYRKANLKMRKSRKIIKQKHHDLLRTYADLRKANDKLQKFSSIAAHDMRNSISAIIGITDILKMKSLQSSQLDNIDFLEMSNKEAIKLDKFINYLLYQAKHKDTHQHFYEEIQLISVLEDVKNALSFKMKDHHVEIIDEIPHTIKASYFPMYQLFLNFIDNSIKYGKKDDKIIIKMHSEKVENGIKIYFNDNGIGIPEKDINNVLESYYQVINGNDIKDGIGLGLHICSEIIKEYNGSIELESEYGVGTTFSIFLQVDVVD